MILEEQLRLLMLVRRHEVRNRSLRRALTAAALALFVSIAAHVWRSL